MKELHRFLFGFIKCNGCGEMIDSFSADDERAMDMEDLECCIEEYHDWTKEGDMWLCPKCSSDPSHRTKHGGGEVKAENMIGYGLLCDKCGRRFESSEGHSFWMDYSDTIEEANCEDWNVAGIMVLCPDCWETCKGVDDQTVCNDCTYRDDCNETVVRTIPHPSDECGKCQYLTKPMQRCMLPEGGECPRIKSWEARKMDVISRNAEVREWSMKDKEKEEVNHD